MELLKDENIKQHMISQIMPYLNKQANDYLSKISYSFFINISKWLDIEIKGPGITKATYDSLSGGERRGIDIAIQLSFIDIGRIQAGIFPDLLILDELLDSSIDSKGISELMKIISIIEKDNKGKIFVISHREELDKDDEFFVNNYHIIKENSFSRVIINSQN
jgi:DNA repair exonuclease SbcCD ATPase subunit